MPFWSFILRSFFENFQRPDSGLIAVKVNSPQTKEVVARIIESRNREQDGWQPEARTNAIRTLREELAADVVTGSAHCPVCNSKVDIYQRPIYKGMITLLRRIYDLGGLSRPVTIKEIGANGGDHGKLRFWGLVMKVYSSKDGSPLGWKVTQAGYEFLLGRLRELSLIHI